MTSCQPHQNLPQPQSGLTFSAKEKDDETGYSYFGARYYDSELSVWLSVDPMADKYPSLSAYMYCAGNPILFRDPNGKEIILGELYRKNEKGENVHKNGVRQFEKFASTKVGQLILSKFAKKDQIIAGHKYEKDGYFHTKKIDLCIMGDKNLTPDGRSGETSNNTARGLVKVDRLQLGIAWNENISGDDNSIETIGHEILVHAFQYSFDFIDDGILNNSNIEKSLKKFGNKNNYNTGNFQHFQESLYDKRLQKYLTPLLQEYYNKNGIKKTNNEINEFIYNYEN